MLFDLQIFEQKEKVTLFLELPDASDPVIGVDNFNNGNGGE